MDHLPIKFKKRDIILKNQIGSGSYSKVYLGRLQSIPFDCERHGRDAENVAVKVSNRKVMTREDCLTEVMTMTKLRHQNIIRIIGVIDDEKSMPWLVMEFMGNGTIFDFISHQKEKQQEVIIHQFFNLTQSYVKILLRMMLDVALGMTYLHSSHDIVHGDLHSKNCFIDTNGTTKIGDFGFSARSEQDLSPYNSMSSRMYMTVLIKHLCRRVVPAHLPNFRWLPPEYLLAGDVNELIQHKPGDVWAFGTLVFQIWSKGQSPYENLNAKQIQDAVFSGRDPFDCTKVEAPATVINLMLNCWEFKPSSRITFNEITATLIENFSCLSP